MEFVYDLEFHLYLLDCCSRGYLDGIDAMRVRTADKIDMTRIRALDAVLFDENTPIAWENGLTKAGYGLDNRIFAYGHMVEGSIDRIGVQPSCRRMGLGRQILKSLIAAARRQSLPRVYTYIHKDNLSSLRLFLQAEFRPVGSFATKKWWNFERLL